QSKVGTAFSMSSETPLTSSPEDAAAAKRFDAFVHGVPLETMGFHSGDDKRMTAPLDYIGVNYYFRQLATAPTAPAPSKPSYDAMGFKLSTGKEGPLTEIGWEGYPRGMYDILQ